ncbi:cytidine deaminase [Spiroplasma clarkii]|uniref:Cytidine deaminase n=1 Tax=Spiroplasma clarkii TaxID=2139 RepID=A0A1Y0L0E6_9MOLU|nr:cytidine deaminase [Spiroplasma clarkii]ARU91451.1 cytidine deaminase [Spiroplasma clarkii]ATX70872.1 cytidine deaminase [Spiroplasma clarkii]
MDKQVVFEELKKLKERAYVPYSHFKVACIIYLKNGEKIIGVNVENAAYNPTICAERAAVPQLVAQGYNKNDVELVALYTDSDKFGSPCGTCRQTLIEILDPNQKMWIFNKNDFVGEYTIGYFLPEGFTACDLA